MSQGDRKKVLFTTVCRPFRGPGEGYNVTAELFNWQITVGQGLFSLRQATRAWAIDYLAHNIETPSLVLHYPSERELVRELKRNDFEYVGINFVVPTFHKARHVTRMVRKYAPNAKIVYGGYGTCLPDNLLEPYADHICREEGIKFMRRLLGESVERPIEHPYAPVPPARIYSYQSFTKTVGHLTGGLGCAHGCDFCTTSHFFKRKYDPFLKTGRDLYEAINELEDKAAARGRELTNLILIDEDFFQQEKRAREFLETVRKEGKTRFITGFGSVKSLSRFTGQEIAEMGFDALWIGFEGTRAGYSKMEGKSYEELFADLKKHGVTIVASMILGYHYQDRQTVMEEMEKVFRIGPAMTQILQYTALPGTTFHKQATEEMWFLPDERVDPDMRKWDGFTRQMEHPHFTKEEIEAFQHELFRLEFKTLGPTPMRIFRNNFQGYMTHKDEPSESVRRLAEMKRSDIIASISALAPAIFFGPTRETRAEAKSLQREILEEFGPMDMEMRIKAWVCVGLAIWTSFTNRIDFFQQPGLLRVEYPQHPEGKGEVPFRRLHGGFHANPFSVFAQDVVWTFKKLAKRMFPSLTELKDTPPLPKNTMNLPQPEPQRAPAASGTPQPSMRA